MNENEINYSNSKKRLSNAFSNINLTHITPNITVDYMSMNFLTNPLT